MIEYQKIIHFFDNPTTQPSTFRIKNGVEKMMMQEERIAQIVKLDLKLQCERQACVIIVMRTNLLKNE